MRLEKQRFRRLPVDARVRNRDAAAQRISRLCQLLISGVQIALQHCANDMAVSGKALLEHFAENDGLFLVVFAAIPVARE